MLKDIVSDLDTIDSIRCFFAILFLARDQKVDLEQIEDNIKITLIQEKFTTWSKMNKGFFYVDSIKGEINGKNWGWGWGHC